MIKSRNMNYEEHKNSTERRSMHTIFCCRILKERDCMEDLVECGMKGRG
jgi:hypothetical protein